MVVVDECVVAENLNPNVCGIKPSATIAINAVSNRLRCQGREVFKLGLGQSPFPVPEPVVEALRENAHQKDYLPVEGLCELREAVAEHHQRSFGFECSAEDVLIGPGSKELMFLLQLTYCGDLIIPSPTWVSYAPQARIVDRPIHLLSTSKENDWHLTPDQLDDHCRKEKGRPRIVILNYPANPTGLTMSQERLEELAEVARKHRAILLSDEIYGKLQHDGDHHSIVPLYPEGTVFSSGLSKWCGAGGWRLGVFVFPRRMRWLKDAMAAVASETYTSTSAPIQYAAVCAFQNDRIFERYLQLSRRVLRGLSDTLVSKLRFIGADVLRPHGGFYLFPDFSAFRDRLYARNIETSEAMCHRLLEETGVALLPGSAFGRAPQELTARLAYVDFDGAKALAASSDIPMDQSLDEAFLTAHCLRVLDAVDRICEWMTRTSQRFISMEPHPLPSRVLT